MEKRCGRTVEKNKYETNAPEIRSWWNHLFEMLEFDAAIPPDKNLSVLLEMFPRRIVTRIVNILGVEEGKYIPPVEKIRVDTDGVLQLRKTDSEGSVFPASVMSICDDKEEFRQRADEVLSSSSLVEKQFGARPAVRPNPYLDFFKRRPDRAAIWRELPPLSLEEMTIGQKAEAITETIARDFVTWIKTLGGDEESYLTVQGIVEMFEIGYPVNSAISLRAEYKEMPSVPQKVANHMKMPKVTSMFLRTQSKRATDEITITEAYYIKISRRVRLHQEIKSDKIAAKQKPHIVAFGSRLPADMQLKPPNKKAFKKWLFCEIPEKLDTMAAVWQGITHLKSTKAFCEYLYFERPELQPPQYLIDNGLMNKGSMDERKQSVHSDDNFGNMLHITSV